MKIFGRMKLLFVGDVPGAMEAWGDIDRAAAESPHQASELLNAQRA